MTVWHIAKTTGRETRAVFYLNRNGIEVFCPERHCVGISNQVEISGRGTLKRLARP